MSRERMLLEVRSEIERLQKIEALLNENEPSQPRGAKRGIKAKAANPGKRTMSPEARQRIAEAQKARWAKFKKAKKA